MPESPKKRDIQAVIERLEVGSVDLCKKNVEAAFEAQCSVAQAASLCGTTVKKLNEWCMNEYGTTATETMTYIADRGAAKFMVWISGLISNGNIDAHKLYGRAWYDNLLQQKSRDIEASGGESGSVVTYSVRVPDNQRRG